MGPAFSIHRLKLITRAAEEPDLELEDHAPGIDRPELRDTRGGVGRRETLPVLVHRAVADDLDDQVRRPFELDELPRFAKVCWSTAAT